MSSSEARSRWGVLAALRPEVEAASGMLDASVTARGTTSAPEISGTGVLQGASVTVRAVTRNPYATSRRGSPRLPPAFV